MKKKELKSLFYLEKEIAWQNRTLRELRERTVSVTSSICGDRTSGSGDHDRLGRLTAEIIDLERAVASNNYLRVKKLKQMLMYIGGVEDSRMRLILTMRFVKGYNWTKIATELGGGNTPDSVRKTCERFLR